MLKNQKIVNWKKIVDKLVMENCLPFGNEPKLTNKKVARYLLGTRPTMEVFKLYELRYLLLKVYPLIHSLFYNPRLNSTAHVKKVYNTNYQNQVDTQRRLGTRLPKSEWKPRVQIDYSLRYPKKNLPPQVLFASITPDYADIINSAAQICKMPSHQERWLSGSITAAISYQTDSNVWNYLTDETQAEVHFHFTRNLGLNKENQELTTEKSKYYGRSRWPSLIVVPDVSNNAMIVDEAKKIGLPIIGLVNSDCYFEIDYPIFAQNQTIHSVYFFCHFLAVLIAKEMVHIQHKRYTAQKSKLVKKKATILPIKAKVNETTNETKPCLKKRFTIFSKNQEEKGLEFWEKPFYFRFIKPSDLKTKEQKAAIRAYYWLSNHTNYATTNRKKQFFNYPLENHQNVPKLALYYFWAKKLNKKILGPKYLHFFFNTTQRRKSKLLNRKNNDLERILSPRQIVNRENERKNLVVNKAFNGKKNCFWAVQEKKHIWQSINHFLRLKKLRDFQLSKKKFRLPVAYKNLSYYWMSLQQWNQTPKFKHKYSFRSILRPIPLNSKQHVYKKRYYKKTHPDLSRREKRFERKIVGKLGFQHRQLKRQKRQKAKQGTWKNWTQKNTNQTN